VRSFGLLRSDTSRCVSAYRRTNPAAAVCLDRLALADVAVHAILVGVCSGGMVGIRGSRGVMSPAADFASSVDRAARFFCEGGFDRAGNAARAFSSWAYALFIFFFSEAYGVVVFFRGFILQSDGH